MDVRDFRIITRKHAPWLFDRVKQRAGQFKLRGQTDEGFETVVAAKIDSITEIPWKDLTLDQDIDPTTTRTTEGGRLGFVFTHRYYTIVWRKNDEEKIRYTGSQKIGGLSVSKLLKLMLSECEAGDTPWVSAVMETTYVIKTVSGHSPKYSFVVYPCDERLFMEQMDQRTEEFNAVLAQRGLTLSSYTVVALNK